MEDRHAAVIPGSRLDSLVSAKGLLGFGTKKGRRCPSCNWLGNAWSEECHKCGSPTVPEEASASASAGPGSSMFFPYTARDDAGSAVGRAVP